MAGEVSGDIQAAALVRELLHRDPSVSVVGVGGPHMAAAGVSLLLESSTWGVIGYVDPLLHLRSYLRRLSRVAQEIRRVRPDVLVLVDFPAFNLRVAARLRSAVPIVYYFPPMVSVRRGDRASRIAPLGMRLLANLRREEDAYRAAGADVVFIGHPVVDLARAHRDPRAARAHFGVPEDARVVGLLPGSRVPEVRAHLPVMLTTAALLHRNAPGVQFLLPVPTEGFRALVDDPIAKSGLPIRVVSEVYDAMACAEVLVTATGTATLEGAVLGVPMVAIYRLPWVSWFIINRIVTIRHAALPNILAGREIVPELLQDRMTPAAIADQVQRFLNDFRERDRARAALLAVAAELGPPGAVGRAVEEVLTVLQRARVASASRGRVRSGG